MPTDKKPTTLAKTFEILDACDRLEALWDLARAARDMKKSGLDATKVEDALWEGIRQLAEGVSG